jgi:hypothetical protein
VADKFRTVGLPDVRIQNLDLMPQWFAQSYDVTVSSGDTTLELESAQPAYRATATPPEGLSLDAVYVGLGNDADYLGRDVRGKAVFFYSMLGLPDSRQEAAIRRATDRGAAAIFNVHMEPGKLALIEVATWVTTGTLFRLDGAGNLLMDRALQRDTLFHAGVVRSLTHSYPPQLLSFSGATLAYHTGYHLQLAAWARFFGVDVFDGLYRFGPAWSLALLILSAFLLGGDSPEVTRSVC